MKIKNSIKTICALALIAAVLSISVFAYANGTVNIYNGSTKLGFGELWTSNGSTSRVLYGQTQASDTAGTIRIRVGYTYIDSSGNEENVYSSYVTNTNSTSASQQISIPDSRTPLNARGHFTIDGHIETMCKAYNLGQGVQSCTHGSSCPWN